MLELIKWLQDQEKIKYITFSQIRDAFKALPEERQKTMMDNRRSNPLKTLDFLIKKRNGSFGSLSNKARELGSLSEEQEDTLDREDRSFPTNPE